MLRSALPVHLIYRPGKRSKQNRHPYLKAI
jgi:hypothetical protein